MRRGLASALLLGLWTGPVEAIVATDWYFDYAAFGSAAHIATSDGYAYVSYGSGASTPTSTVDFRVIDISDPASPVWRGGLVLPDDAAASKVVGQHAYVAGGSSGLVVVDVSDPDGPTIEAQLDTPGSAQMVDVIGNVAFVADGVGDLRIVDVSEPAAPVELGSATVSGSVTDVVAATPDLVLVVTGTGLYVIDTTDKSAPSQIGFAPTDGLGLVVELYAGFAYVGTTEGIQVFDVSEPTDPEQTSALALPFVDSYRGVRSMAFEGARAYVATADGDLKGGLWVLDVSQPTMPVVIGVTSTEGSSTACVAVIAGAGWLCTPPYGYGLQVFDLSIPDLPAEVRALALPDGAFDVDFFGQYSVVAAGSEGVAVLGGLKGPLPLSMVGVVDTPGSAVALQVVGALAYVADDAGGLRIVDVSDPTQPTERSSFPTLGSATSVEVVGQIAYVASKANGAGGTSGWEAIDVADPENPFALSATATSQPLLDITLHEGRAFVADGGIKVYDVTDPTNPFEVQAFTYPQSMSALQIEFSDGFMYTLAPQGVGAYLTVAAESQQQWSLAGEVAPIISDIHHFSIEGDLAFLHTGAGVRVYRAELVSSGGPLLHLGGELRASGPGRIRVRGRSVLAADADFGLRVIDLGPGYGTEAVALPLLTGGGRLAMGASIVLMSLMVVAPSTTRAGSLIGIRRVH